MLALLAMPPARAQAPPHVSFDRIDLAEVPGSEFIATIIQDRRGFMWFGSGVGLIRYDGARTRVFRHDPNQPDSLPNDHVWRLFEDQDGYLWVGTDHGLSRFDPVHETFVNFTPDLEDPEALHGETILSITQMPDGRILAGSKDHGLNLLDQQTGKFRHFVHDPEDPSSIPLGRIQALRVSPNEMPWIATTDGIARFDPATETFQTVQSDPKDQPGLTRAPVRDLLFDSDGRLWVAMNGGLGLCDPETMTVSWYGDDGSGPRISGRVYGLAEDHLGRLWVARYHGDLILLDRDRNGSGKRAFLGRYGRELDNEHSLPSSLLDTLYVDRRGVLWVGTFGGGVAKHHPHPGGLRTFVHNPKGPNGLGSGKVNEMLAVEGDGILVGGMSGLQRMTDMGVFEEIALPFSHGSHVPFEIHELCAGEGDTFWAAGARGLIHLSASGEVLWSERWFPRDLDPPFGHGLIRDLVWDPGIGLWIATTEGLYLRPPDGSSAQRFEHDPADPGSLSSPSVEHLMLDGDGFLWVGGNAGLDRFDTESGTFRRYVLPHGEAFTNWNLNGMLARANGEIWAAHVRGVAVLRPGAQEFEIVPQPPESGNWNARFLVETEDGQLMVGFREGLKLLDPVTRRYDPRLMRLESYQDKNISTDPLPWEDGTVLIPGHGGIFVVRPAELPAQPPPSPVVLTDVQLYHESLGGGALMEELEFRHSDNHISFGFAALDYVDMPRIRFEILLEGLEDAWRDVGTANEVSFPNLPPGDYTFHVRALSTHGMEPAAGDSKSFRIQRPLWGHLWFQVLSVALVFFSGWAVQRYRHSRVRRRNAELEDLTRRMEEESKRRVTVQENLAITLDSIADGVISMDEDLRIIAINPVGAALTGWRPEDAVGRPIGEVFQVVDAKTREPVTNPRRWLRSPETGLQEPVRALLQGAEGKEYLIASSVAAMRRPSGEGFGTVVVFRDITDRAVLEGQLAQAQKMESLGRLAGGIAHDFNNLLTSIQGYADLVRMELEQPSADGSRSHEYIEAVLRSSQRGSDLIGQLLAFSRRADATTEHLDLHVVLEQAVKMLQRTLDPAIEITLDARAPEHVVDANASLLVNVFLNLGINAGDAMAGSGSLRFSTDLRQIEEGDAGHAQGLLPGTYLQVDVQDDGSGMSETMRERIFEPFFTTKDLGDGTGLGLPTALSTIQAFGGTILVDSEPGRGTTMRMLLPLVADGKPKVDRHERARPVRGESTLLMIEDDYAVRELCSDYLTSLGYRILLAPNGEEGLELFRIHRKAIDLLVVDYLMPLRNGMEVAEAVRAQGGEQPILMMTGFSLGVTAEEILAQGVQAVLTKPFLPEDLAEKIGALLGACGEAAEASESG